MLALLDKSNLLGHNPLYSLFPYTVDMIVTALIVLCVGVLVAIYRNASYNKSIFPMVVQMGGLILGFLSAVANHPERVRQINADGSPAHPFPWITYALLGAFAFLTVLAIRALCNTQRPKLTNGLVANTYMLGAAVTAVAFGYPALLDSFPGIGTNIQTWITFTEWTWAAVFLLLCLEALLLGAFGLTQYRTRQRHDRFVSRLRGNLH